MIVIYKRLRFFFFSSRRRHTRYWRDWSSDVCSSDLPRQVEPGWLQPLLSFPGAADVAVHVEPFPAHPAADRLKRQLGRLQSTPRMAERRAKLPDPALDAAAEDTADLAGRFACGEDRLLPVGLYCTE